MANATIKIDGVGFSTTVEVTDEETILDALKRANIDIGEDGLDVSVDGEQVEDPAAAPAVTEDGGQERQVTATPKRANLG
jgi:hypothetical protein